MKSDVLEGSSRTSAYGWEEYLSIYWLSISLREPSRNIRRCLLYFCFYSFASQLKETFHRIPNCSHGLNTVTSFKASHVKSLCQLITKRRISDKCSDRGKLRAIHEHGGVRGFPPVPPFPVVIWLQLLPPFPLHLFLDREYFLEYYLPH